MSMHRAAAAFAFLVLVLALAGCGRVMDNMHNQPRRGPGEGSPLFDDGRATRPPPEGSVAHARGAPAAVSSGRAGQERLAEAEAAEAQQALPQPLTRELLQRGQERYGIYCLPCHSALGDGQGPVVRRGFPAPPSYHIARLRDAPDRHFYDVITHGHGVMYSYADRVDPADRWAITAYIRALQLSQHARVDGLPPELAAALTGTAAQAAGKERDGGTN